MLLGSVGGGQFKIVCCQEKLHWEIDIWVKGGEGERQAAILEENLPSRGKSGGKALEWRGSMCWRNGEGVREARAERRRWGGKRREVLWGLVGHGKVSAACSHYDNSIICNPYHWQSRLCCLSPWSNLSRPCETEKHGRYCWTYFRDKKLDLENIEYITTFLESD